MGFYISNSHLVHTINQIIINIRFFTAKIAMQFKYNMIFLEFDMALIM